MNQLTSLILVLLVQYSHGATNRDTMMDMVTQKLGVTFYTSTELGVVSCILCILTNMFPILFKFLVIL